MTPSPETSLVSMEHNEAIDSLELAFGASDLFRAVELPLIHRFTEGQYIREIFMPAKTWVVSKIHKTQHPYFVLSGRVSVWINGEWQTIQAPYSGTTEAGTRRVLYIHEDCIWATVHATNIKPSGDSDWEIQEAVDRIEEKIIEPHDNFKLTPEMKEKLLYNINGRLNKIDSPLISDKNVMG